MNTARNAFSATGIQTAGLAVSGQFPGSPNITNAVEEYNGTSWTTVNSINTKRQYSASVGIQTAALTFGGYNGTAVSAKTEEYDGTSWTESSDLSTARQQHGGAGTQSAGLAFGGQTPPDTTATEEYVDPSFATQTLTTSYMSDYKNIIGKGIRFVSSNLDNDQAEGQIWYNSTDGAFKSIVALEAWSSSSHLTKPVSYTHLRAHETDS